MSIGARTIKTGVAVAISILICKFLRIEPAIFAAITAVVNMQPSVGKALRNARQQIAVHVLGVALAIVLGMIFGTGPLVIGMAVILIIALCNRLGWSGAITLGVVSIVFILDAPQDQFLMHAGIRSLAVFIGLAVALTVNRILRPPAYKAKLWQGLQDLFQESSSYFLRSMVTFVSSAGLTMFKPAPPVQLEHKLNELMEMYDLAREELTAEDNPLLWERLLEICRGFIERGQNIDEMTAQRVKRRQGLDSPLPTDGMSPEFRAILDLLMVGKEKLAVQLKRVSRALNEDQSTEAMEDDPEFWAEFDQVMDAWQRKVSGVFYLRAMMEIAVVATEIRWAGRRLRTINKMKIQYKGADERI